MLCLSQNTAKSPKEYLEKNGIELIWNPVGRPLKEEELIAELSKVLPVHGIIVGVDPITRKVIESLPDLKIIAKHGVGVDNIDLVAVKERGVIVTNAPGSNSESVADLTWALILAAARQIPKADRVTRQGRWDRLVGYEIYGKTIGIIGTGQIGLAVARRARGFNMKILAYDKFPNEKAAKEIGITYVSLEQLLKEADIITVHVPLTDETRGLIGRNEFEFMKRTAIFINTSRGEIVDEEALYEALKSNRIWAAGLDVYSKEPPIGNPLLELENVVLTPHLGAYTVEANLKMGMAAAKSIVQTFKGEDPENRVV
ncbi:D-isomer specific 2-hydroxyacid dehydrogenase NAD-binding protein [Pseudothermotoga thermarum DSM 5069]|uniref:D-isomer specific 2-hydroxyacid dehydrogenase NAD-binding protein n=1 Tax=Pseudothermotoga thermarum DSM 5069 TaxID=688269 RepID=F7YYP5_9THEM|nr:D-isomer specific 2-hydroxyacid dehydrogenase NAD-binding protein [Pseudothermotoga thermarum DSM 5069]